MKELHYDKVKHEVSQQNYMAGKELIQEYVNLYLNAIEEVDEVDEPPGKTKANLKLSDTRPELLRVNFDSLDSVKKEVSGCLFDVLTGNQETRFMGLKLNKSKAYEIVDLPEYHLEKISKFAFETSWSPGVMDENGYIPDINEFTLKNGVIQDIKGIEDKIKQDCTIYANSKKAETYSDQMQIIQKALETLIDNEIIDPDTIKSVKPYFPIAGVNTNTGKIELDYKQIASK